MAGSGPELVRGFADECDKRGFSTEGTALRGLQCGQMAKRGHVSPLEGWMAAMKYSRAGDLSAGKDLVSDPGLDKGFRRNGWVWKGCKGMKLQWSDCQGEGTAAGWFCNKSLICSMQNMWKPSPRSTAIPPNDAVFSLQYYVLLLSQRNRKYTFALGNCNWVAVNNMGQFKHAAVWDSPCLEPFFQRSLWKAVPSALPSIPAVRIWLELITDQLLGKALFNLEKRWGGSTRIHTCTRALG